jgi:DNA-directed RNA polymerase specialized sigma subunit
MKNNYVTNKQLLPILKKYKETGILSEELGKMFYLIARNLSHKSNWSSYTWKEDMIQEAVFTCTKYIKNFDSNKSQNPFAYITQICNNCFIAYVKKQKKHSNIKDTCYKEIDKLDEQNNVWINKSIDYTVLISNKKKIKNNRYGKN